ncbi:MAG: hypothetical protein F4061_17470, partial [Acidobacteria bacterium]|nr:hypothetical protein [Acidobacteriota bacterium]
MADTQQRTNPPSKASPPGAAASKKGAPPKKAPVMFGEIANPSIQVGARKWYTLPLSIIAHVVAIGAFVIVPLMAVDALPT